MYKTTKKSKCDILVTIFYTVVRYGRALQNAILLFTKGFFFGGGGVVFPRTRSLCEPDYPGMHSVAQTGLKLRDLSVPTS